jgi:tellurite resistance protein
MISRQAVIEYLNKHPNHSTWQMRLHFLQDSRQLESQSQISIGSIANQLNYILRDLEAIGTISPRQEANRIDRDSERAEHNTDRAFDVTVVDRQL